MTEATRPERLLVVVAHPGDGADRIDPDVRRWVADGSVAELVCGTSGELEGDDPTADPLERAATLEAAQREAAADAGYAAVTFLHRPHGALVNDLALREQLVGIIRRFRPDTVATFDPRILIGADGELVHVDHREVGQAALDAIVAAGMPSAFAEQARAQDLTTHASARLLLFGSPQVVVRIRG